MSTSEKELAERLGRVPLFATATARQRRTIAKLGKVLSWSQGRAGVVEGSKAAAFYLILEGGVEVTRAGTVLARLNQGDFFGEAALLTRSERNATVTATTDSRFFVLGRPAFTAAIKSNPDIALTVLEAMAARVAADL